MIRPRTANLSRIVAASRSSVILRRTISTPTATPLAKVEPTSPSSPSVVLFDSLTATYKPVPVSADGPASAASADGTAPASPARSLGLAWYTCGPTVYDAAHLGHARTYVTLDLIRRSVLHAHSSSHFAPSGGPLPPPPPLFVMNVTDVDDKILNRASELGVEPTALARRYEKEFWEDMDGLNVMRPDVVTRVTEHVEGTIVPYIERIVGGGMAYVVPDYDGGDDGGGGEGGCGGEASSSVYFDVGAFESASGGINRYGKLAPSAAATGGDFFSWDGGDGGGDDAADDAPRRRKSQKRDPRDFVLWKGRKPTDGATFWDSPWGPGRPGWHIECSAMIEYVAETFRRTHRVMVHAGGVDLRFPHHTNEIAQAEAYRQASGVGEGPAKQKRWEDDDETDKEEEGEEWIPHWVHTGHLHIRGMKMSKSLKNFVTIRELLSSSSSSGSSSSGGVVSPSLSSPSDDFRLWCLGLSGSYRGPATYSEARIEEARTVRGKIVRFLIDGEEWIRKSCYGSALPKGEWDRAEIELVELAASCAASCKRALVGSVESSGGYDLDGSSYLQALVELAEAGSAYIAASKEGCSPVEAIRAAILTLREHLSLVGFTDRTVKAGIHARNCTDVAGNNTEGDKGQLIQEFIDFRSKVRMVALLGMRSQDGAEGKATMGDLLKLCDDVRDKSLPAIGVEILDSRSEEGTDVTGKWRFCVPKKEGANVSDDAKSSTGESKKARKSLEIIPVEDLFRVGYYEGMFSAYNSDGLPTHNADGTEVSKRLQKKLARKREKYAKNS